MALRQALAVVLAAGLAAPASATAPDFGLVKGNVTTVAGTPVSGADVDLLSLDNGKLTRLRTDGGGSFEASLAPGSYTVELQKGLVVVRGPRMVAVAAGDSVPAELVVATAQAAPEGSDPNTAAGKPNKGGDVVALVAFSAALAGVATYAATRGPEDRQPPSSSPRR